ncbi:hypothetical protein EMCG_06102 [[Emmonsia] crescens]|uniref:Uncharacterized protein n=1 Tax=[Emmonsia] crescens TaxID=73230 RepID=A0A0G2JBW9_9EURO|nr:hypothetical protein EMCG_06102 [Emmonsia crescens UAMH 3008]
MHPAFEVVGIVPHPTDQSWNTAKLQRLFEDVVKLARISCKARENGHQTTLKWYLGRVDLAALSSYFEEVARSLSEIEAENDMLTISTNFQR